MGCPGQAWYNMLSIRAGKLERREPTGLPAVFRVRGFQYSVPSFSPTIRLVLTLCFMALLAVASLIPGRPQPSDSAFIWLVAETPKLLQKVLHVGLYGVLALLCAWTLESIESRTQRFLVAFILVVTFGAVLEWYQTKVPGRVATVIDVALNAAGAALGLLAAAFLL